MFSFLAKKKQRVLKSVHNYSHVSAFLYLVSKFGFSMVDLKSIFKITEQYECSLLDARKILLLRVFDFVSYRVGKEPSQSTIFFVNGSRINILKYILRVGDLLSIVEEPFTSNGLAP